MQKRHPLKHLLLRGGVALVSQGLMLTGAYPLVPHAVRRMRPVRAALKEWGISAALSALRPVGFLPLPGAKTQGPRPIIVVHGYAMNRAGFLLLAHRLSQAGLGPVFGFEYWTLGRTAAAARQLGWFIDEVRAATGATEVDVIGHSMGGVVARYYVALTGGDDHVKTLVTLGSPHGGTDVSSFGIGHASRELVLGSALVTRLGTTPPPAHTKLVVIASRADALVPGDRQPAIPGAETILFDDLGHVALLGSRRVAAAIIDRLRA